MRGRAIRVPDRGVRPTSSMTREAVFDVLGPKLVLGARVLDLYAGSGALGIEALSRGASYVTFLEGSRVVARRLQENLRTLGLTGRARVACANLDRGVLPSGVTGPWDLVFLDPPYAGDAGPRWLATLAAFAWPPGGGIVIHERSRESSAGPPPGWTLATERSYGSTAVSFYRAIGPADRSEEEAS